MCGELSTVIEVKSITPAQLVRADEEKEEGQDEGPMMEETRPFTGTSSANSSRPQSFR
jgi:hypothetical protein